jgi:hypothetical protein
MKAFDPSGIDLQRRGMDTYLANKEAQRSIDYGPAGNAIDQAVHMTGPLPDPKWQAFFQALADQGVKKVVGGPSPDGSNQVRGIPTQPDYFTSGDTFMGRPTQSAQILKSRARPMPEGHEAFLKRLYGGV